MKNCGLNKMDLPFNKIIVDSRHADAGNSNSFEISLPETLALPHNAVCYVCDLQVTNTFSSVDPNRNTFYWIENELSQNVLNRLFLTNKSYTPDSLATELQTKLNESSIFRPNAWVRGSFRRGSRCVEIYKERAT